jgi:dTDP-4-amino-4,6-dideoxygalactose transaminase
MKTSHSSLKPKLSNLSFRRKPESRVRWTPASAGVTRKNKISVPALNLQAEYREIKSDLTPRLLRILKSGRYILGGEVETFETNLARFVGTKFAIGLASGSDALLLALTALGVKAGDEIITSPFSFIATATAIARLGAKPVFVDIDPNTFNLNPSLIKGKITSKTRGLIPVHLFGNPCPMNEMTDLAKKYNLFMVEDCAQAIGAAHAGKQVGSFGEFGAFSFYPTKNIGAMGDAGAITTNRSDWYEKIKSLHLHGEVSRKEPYRHVSIGINSRLDEIQAAVLNVKLKRLKKWNELRQKIAGRYDKLLFGIPEIRLPHAQHSVFHQYSIRTHRRDELQRHLRNQGIQSGVYYPIPLHLQPCFDYLGYQPGDFPASEQLSREILSLPMYPQLKPAAQEKIAKAIRKFYL